MPYVAATIIGFAQRRRTISEGDRPFMQYFDITVDVRSTIPSEITYGISFETLASNMGRTANVGDNTATNIIDHDALFGNFNATSGNLEVVRLLLSGSTILSTPLTLTIVNDFNPEPLECFTISIVIPARGRGCDIECFDDDDNSDSFFCLHEICIQDEDGLFRDICFQFVVEIVAYSSTFRTFCCCIC